ncbi:MAG TPA: PQQ-binding-like beta-propeller repeat protein [Actinoplanes sp.]|nr:PQQ-binding-like beta-propeller repeat protein [Actinoplanes sp.]
MAAVKGGNMAGPGENETQPEFAVGVSKAAEPEPTAETEPVSPQQAGTGGDEPTRAEIEYAAPVDPWAAAEAASIAAGGKPSYEAAPVQPGGTWTIVGGTEPTVAEVEPKPRRVGRALLIGGGAGVVTAGVVAAAVLFWPGHPALDFHRTEEVKRFAPAVAFTSSFNATAVVGDRAYFAGVDEDGTLRVLATDTGAGDKPLWESTAAGKSTTWRSLRATSSVVLVESGLESATGSFRVVALDPETGSQRWQQSITSADTLNVGAERVLWTDRTRNRLVGISLVDGREMWSEPDENRSTIYPVMTPDYLSKPAAVSGQTFESDLTDRFVQFGSDRTVTVRELKTGKILQTRENVSAGTEVAAYDGRLYVLETGTPKRIFQYDLANLAAEPGLLYTAASSETVAALTPCGDQLCFLRSTGYDRATSEIVAVGGTGWTAVAPGAKSLIPLGDQGLLTTNEDGASLIVDRKVVWTLDGGAAARLDAGNVLRFSDGPGSSVGNRTLSGFHLGDEAGAVVEMGEIRDIRSDSCSWNTAVIACVGEKDLVIHSFAG